MLEILVDSIKKYRPQRQNANKHNPRGLGMLDDAMAADGYVAPMTAVADGEIIDGSARLDVAASRFGDDVLVVPHDGTKPIVMVRTDIPSADDPRAKRIALAANRIAEVDLKWDAAILSELSQEVDISGLWDEGELKMLLNSSEQPSPLDEFKSYDESIDTEYRCPKCAYEWSGKPK